MDSWADDRTKEAMRGAAEMLANFSNQLKMRLMPHDHDMTPDDALLLLRQITSFADSMSDTCEAAKQMEGTYGQLGAAAGGFPKVSG